MRAYELIQKKRNGGELTSEEVRWLVHAYVRDEIPDAQMAAFLMSVYFRGMSAEETASLTMAMVESGDTLDLSRIRGRPVDKHSTGGVGDKTSLVLVPLVASAGVPVAKLSGRGLGHTGGTLDKLEAIPGVRTQLSPAEMIDQVNRVGCAIAGQSERLVPADKRIYALRDVTATVDSIPLIASSVMSKKIAAGSEAIVLDVKAGSGAFMKTHDDARALARTMVTIGRAVGRQTVALISAMDEPLGRAVGNALEVEEAIGTLRGDGPSDLQELCLALGAHMAVLGGAVPDLASGRALLLARLADGEAHRKFREMIAAQGGDPEVIDHPDRLPRAPVRRPIVAEEDGWVVTMDVEAIGEAAAALGAGRTRADDRIDPGAGLVIERKLGAPVRRGEPLAILHTRDPMRADEGIRRVRAAYRLGPEAPQRALQVHEVIA